MRTYVVSTGTLFALVVLAHIARFVQEGPELARDPWFILATVVSAGLAAWAWLLLRAGTGSQRRE